VDLQPPVVLPLELAIVEPVCLGTLECYVVSGVETVLIRQDIVKTVLESLPAEREAVLICCQAQTLLKPTKTSTWTMISDC